MEPRHKAIRRISGGIGNQLDSHSAMINRASQPQRLLLHESTQSYNLLIIVYLRYLFILAKVIYLLETFNYSSSNDQIITIEYQWLTLGWRKGLVGSGDNVAIINALNVNG